MDPQNDRIQEPPDDHGAPSGGRAGEGLEIVIAEDSRTQAQQLRYLLERHGYRVRLAENGATALASLRARRADLVISDIMMPEMNGYELCASIKSADGLQGIPVILLTSMGEPQDVLNGLESGADNFVVKPYDDAFLLSRVEQALARRGVEPPANGAGPVQIEFAGRGFQIDAPRARILELFLSTYEAAESRNAELLRTQEAFQVLNDRLEQKVWERTQALQAEVGERRRAESEVRRLNEDLERRVSDRTAQLQAAVDELEAFSYSVSHDLRAPLRAINGFSSLMAEEYGPHLPETCVRYLGLVAENAKQMARLIDDLLTSSRVNRHPMQRQVVAMKDVVNEVVGSLSTEYEGREVDFQVGDLPPVMGDPVLVREVLTNLLSNALKFTRKRQRACIEIGTIQQADETVYFVRDNGVGFDMAYAHKLFGVFQRLHHASDYEGTGVGLSIVQRVVQRHGGRVWAESEIDHGATFYFVLPGVHAPPGEENVTMPSPSTGS